MSPGTRTALVTGANRGLGRTMALGLARSGIAVGLLGRSEPGLAAVAKEITAAGGRAVVALADVRDFEVVEDAVAVVEDALGEVDLLVNSAGVIDPVEAPAWEADPDDWWSVVEIDLRGPFHLVRAVVPGMVERGHGRVVNLNSNAGAQDREIYSAYCAAKAGLFRLTGNLHLAGNAHGLRSFEISPGTMRSDMTASMPLHANRTEWADPQWLVDLLLGVAGGRLDPWSGCFLRVGVDTVESLTTAAESVAEDGSVPTPLRRLNVVPWGSGDRLSE